MVGQTTSSLREWLVNTENAENTIFSNNQPYQYFMEKRVVWPIKGTGGLQHHKFLIFDGKQHPKKFGSVDVKITYDFCS